MTNEEYYELISTFRTNFTPTGATCRKYSNNTCDSCIFYNHYVKHCGLYIKKPDKVLPEFYEKVLLLTPEKLL